jgi:hypothetical protein
MQDIERHSSKGGAVEISGDSDGVVSDGLEIDPEVIEVVPS